MKKSMPSGQLESSPAERLHAVSVFPNSLSATGQETNNVVKKVDFLTHCDTLNISTTYIINATL